MYVYDAANATTRRVVSGYSEPMGWSPDGRWLLILAEYDFRRGTESLLVTPATHESPTWIVRHVDFSPATWASNGAIYYWDTRFGARHRVDPPAAWLETNPGSFREQPRLFAYEYGDVLFFYPESEREEVVRMSREGAWVLPYAEFTDGRRFLVHIPDYSGGYTAVIDHWGITRSRIRDFYGTTVSGDGSLVAGYVGEEGHYNYISSALYVGDSRGTWSTRILNVSGSQAIAPELSSVGSHIAYRSLTTHQLLIGTLDVTVNGQTVTQR